MFKRLVVVCCLFVAAPWSISPTWCRRAAGAEPEKRPADAPDAKQETEAWTIGVVADNRGGTPPHAAILKRFKEADVQLIINLGDMVYPAPGGEWEGVPKQYREVFGEKAGDDWLARRTFVTAGGWEEEYMNQAQKKADLAKLPEPPKQKKFRPGYEPDNAAGQEFYERYFKYKERAGKPGEAIVEYTPDGDYYVKYRGLHLLSLYISDEWANVKMKHHLHDDPEARRAALTRQTAWLRSKLKEIRTAEPHAPLIVISHKQGWFSGANALADIVKALAEYNVDVALCGDGHFYSFVRDEHTLKLMAPASFSGKSDGYFLIRITPSSGAIDLDHFLFTGELKHQHHKLAGKPLPADGMSKK